ncbi:hypothetical protein D3C80_2010940 [compost metagenome]
MFDVQQARAPLMRDEVDAATNQLPEVLLAIGNPFDVADTGHGLVEGFAVAFTKKQAATIAGKVFQRVYLKRAPSVVEDCNFLAQDRHVGE